jgi:FMN phosphatase YigB (HAD superfamily)
VTVFKGLIVDFGGVLTNPLLGVMRDFCRAEGLAEDALTDLFTRDSRGRAAFANLERGDISQIEWEAVTAGLLGVSAAGLLRRVLATLAPAEPMLEVVSAARAAGYATACLTNSFGLAPYDPYAPWELEKRFDVVVVSEQERGASRRFRYTNAPSNAWAFPLLSACMSTTSRRTWPRRGNWVCPCCW